MNKSRELYPSSKSHFENNILHLFSLYFSLFFRNSNILTTNYNHIYFYFLPPTAPAFPTCSLPIVIPSASKDLFLSMCKYLCLHQELHEGTGTCDGSQRHETPWSWSYRKVWATGHDISAVNWTSILLKGSECP